MRLRGALAAVATGLPAATLTVLPNTPAFAQVEPGMPCDPTAGGVFVTPSGDILVCRPQPQNGPRDSGRGQRPSDLSPTIPPTIRGDPCVGPATGPADDPSCAGGRSRSPRSVPSGP
ncbi:hypothetical protein [Nocardia sp. alder85J]|uniref:hypothetical protein n=1 Tax=Nocardia sp. alder85J TaxID=2862949 RepID=UPI001CD4DEF1|nr:hypothetical protein [Nocardia sp. alder85J]MCX4096262.1 hypothetical protein [Nocardia sp. alder85J]